MVEELWHAKHEHTPAPPRSPRPYIQIAEIVRRNAAYAHSTAAARCLAIKYPILEAEVVFAVEQARN